MGPREAAEKLLAAFNNQDLAALQELYDPSCQVLWPGRAHKVDRQHVLDIHRNVFKAFPNAKLTPFNVLVDGDQAAAECTFWATHTGVLSFARGDVLPTGKVTTYDELVVLRVRNGKIVHQRWYTDRLDLLLQLGQAPEPLWGPPDGPGWGPSTSPSGPPLERA